MNPPTAPTALTGPTAAAAAPAAAAPFDISDPLPEGDTAAPIRLGLWALVVGFAGFVAWAALAPLDQGVIAPATVVTETRRLTIQHLNGGVVRQVAVAEGQPVKAGDLLVELEEATVRAGFEQVRQNYLSQRAQESRLLAEAAGAPRIRFHDDLRADDPVSALQMAAQEQLFAARRAAFAAETAAAQESMAGLRGQAEGLRQSLDSRRQQAGLVATQLANVTALAEQGYAPRSQVLQLQQQAQELRGAIADGEAQAQRVRAAVAEVEQRLAQRRQELLKEVNGQLADVRRDVQANQERMAAAQGELRRFRITAPKDGQVVALAVSGNGSVVGPGQRLMDLVPQQTGLLFDAKVPLAMVDRVRAGDLTELRFASFTDAPTLVVEGRVLSVSGDAVAEVVGGAPMPHYLARVELTEAGQRALGARELHPGMPAEVLIKSGERTVLQYLLHPLTKRIAGAMKEV
jgi:protease secretion system membrane fusion protein